MGKRYEKSKKDVGENKQTLEGLKSDSETLQKEYAPLTEIVGLQGLLDDEVSDSIHNVSVVEVVESERIGSGTDEAEKDKEQITENINSEISKLTAGLDKLRKSSNLEFGKQAVEQSSREYKKQIDKFRNLIGELGDSTSSGNSFAGEGAANSTEGIVETSNDTKELFFFDESPKSDGGVSRTTSPEENKLRQMGVNRVNLASCHETNKRSVVNAVEKMFNEHPELRGQVSEINCTKMRKGTYAAYGPTAHGTNFGGVLNINSDYFSSPHLDSDLSEKSKLGWFIPNASTESVIEHELGHGMHLELCALSCGVKNGSFPDAEIYNRVVQQYIDDMHADAIVESACNAFNIEFDSWEFSRQLSKYGGSNYGEAIAEAVSEVEHNANPRPMAMAIYQELISYKRNLERRNSNDV